MNQRILNSIHTYESIRQHLQQVQRELGHTGELIAQSRTLIEKSVDRLLDCNQQCVIASELRRSSESS
jgi:hypothetical protein